MIVGTASAQVFDRIKCYQELQSDEATLPKSVCIMQNGNHVRGNYLLTFKIAVFCFLIWSGIGLTSYFPPYFAITVGVLGFPSRVGIPFSNSELTERLRRFPETTIHNIDGKEKRCVTHEEAYMTIFYRPTFKAHLTALRMVRNLNDDWSWAHLVSKPLSPELERDCDADYDVIILPPAEYSPPKFN